MNNYSYTQKIIFVSGVHGVGKTSLCESLASAFHIGHFTASKLIANETKDTVFLEKDNDDQYSNQISLLNAIDKHLNSDNWYLIDGHFCLINKKKRIIRIPDSIFQKINPRGIICLFDRPEHIRNRIIKREQSSCSQSFISNFQEEELSYSRYVASKLDIPYLKSNPFSERQAIDLFLSTLIE